MSGQMLVQTCAVGKSLLTVFAVVFLWRNMHWGMFLQGLVTVKHSTTIFADELLVITYVTENYYNRKS